MVTNLLKYFKDLRENYDNVKNIEGFVADDYWGDTDYIPESFKQGDRIVNPCYKYNPHGENKYDQECVKKTLEESTSPEQTKVLKKVFGIDTPATTQGTPDTPGTSDTPVTPVTPVAPTTPVAPVAPVVPTDNLCSANILDFQCNKNLKIVIWCLIIVCVLLVISFIVYIMYNSKQKENATSITPIKHFAKSTTTDHIPPSPTTADVSKTYVGQKMKYQNNSNQKEGFLKRLIGGKSKRKN
jgi:hypothetical protein